MTTKPDTRARSWRVRVRLYRASAMLEPLADTDPTRDPGAPGDAILHGLPAVAEYVAQLALDYHNAPCEGLELQTLRHSLRGLRPTISRRGGDAVWRLRYSVGGEPWLARVDVLRV